MNIVDCRELGVMNAAAAGEMITDNDHQLKNNNNNTGKLVVCELAQQHCAVDDNG